MHKGPFLFFVFVFYFGFCWANKSHAQLKIDDAIGINEAINRLVGQGVKVSNIRVNCPSSSGRPFGYFTDNSGTLGIEDGLIMTSGSAINAIGPNNSGTKSQSNKNEKQDPDLAQIIASGEKQFDACIIEFDVEVFADTLIFDYVFGSEEYLEFIKDYHDVFGFFISGPGISGKLNLATLPGGFDPVSVKNINNATNSQLYIDNGTGSTPFESLFLQYDGFTKRLESKVAVQVCQKYSLKLAICDIKDDIYDAGIFIAGKSLRTKAPKLSLRYEHPKFKTAIEGCNGVFVKVTRQSKINEAITFILKYGGSASNNLDYGNVPDSIQFIPGQVDYEYFIPILTDQELDDRETILVDLINPCPGLPQVDQLSIPIRETFEYNQMDEKICFKDSIQLNKKPSEDFKYSWAPALGLSCIECPSPWAKAEATRKYWSKAVDIKSGCFATDSLEVKVEPIPTANFSFETNDNYTNLDVFFKNQSINADKFSWSFGDGGLSQEREPLYQYTVGFDQDTVYYPITLTAQNTEAGCVDTAKNFVKIGDPFFIPNLITANKDNFNDSFFIRGIRAGKWSLILFNRWGLKIYETDTYDLNWQGESVSSGVYFYKIQNQPGDRIFTGWVSVLK